MQFEYINAEASRRMARGTPVISVDTKKKELVGRFKNGGRHWRPKGQPERVNVIDRENDRVAWGRGAGQAAGKAGVGLGDAVFEVAWQAVRLPRSTLARDRG